MGRPIATTLILVLFAFISYPASSQDLKTAIFPSAVPMSVPNFRLSDTTGAAHELYAYAQESAIVLYIQGNGCPIVRQRYPYMREMRAHYEPKGVKFLYVNSNDLDTSQSVAEETADFGVEVPVLMDVDQVLARTLGLSFALPTRTVHMMMEDSPRNALGPDDGRLRVVEGRDDEDA